MMGPKKTQWEMFWAKVDKNGPLPDPDTKCVGNCWLWKASKRAQGQGYFSFDGTIGCASRFSYLMHYEEIPEGLNVNHWCNRGECTNPDHLYVGTQLQNIHQMIEEGRQRPAEEIRKQMTGSANHRAILTEDDVRRMREIRNQLPQPSYETIAALFGVRWGTVKSVCLKRSWKHLV